MPLLVSSVVLFYTGAAFAYFLVFPVMFQFFVSTTPAGVSMMTDMTQYLDFVVLLFFAFGLAFEIPIATVLLVRTGMVRIESLGKQRGFVMLGIFVVAAFITPPDAVSQTMMVRSSEAEARWTPSGCQATLSTECSRSITAVVRSESTSITWMKQASGLP